MMTPTNDSRPTLDIASAAPDTVAIFGRGYLGEPDDYCKSPWKAWIVRLRSELTTEEIITELYSAIELLRDVGRNLANFTFAAKNTLRIGKKQRMGYYKKAVRELKQKDLASEFGVSKGTISRWLSGARESPLPFLHRLEDLEMERYGRVSTQIDTLWLALCQDPLDDPDTTDQRLVQLYEFGMAETMTPEDLLDLAGPLTPQAMARIEEALNTPIGELQTKV